MIIHFSSDQFKSYILYLNLFTIFRTNLFTYYAVIIIIVIICYQNQAKRGFFSVTPSQNCTFVRLHPRKRERERETTSRPSSFARAREREREGLPVVRLHPRARKRATTAGRRPPLSPLPLILPLSPSFDRFSPSPVYYVRCNCAIS